MLVKQLTAKIGADTKEFDTAMKGTSKSLQNCRKQLNKVGKVMAVAGAAIVGAMTLIIKKTAAAGDQIHKMSLRTGFSAEALSELKYAAEISGASIETLEKGIKKMSKSLTDASLGLETYVRSFDRIGLSVEELMNLSPEKQFFKIANAIAGMESPTLRAATAQEIFGRAGTELLPLFAAGAEGLDELRQKAHELGIVFDQEAANKAAALTDAMTTLKGAFTGIGQTIALEFMPYITGIADAFADSMIDIRKSSKGIVKSIVGFFKILVRTIEGVILAFNSLKVIVFGVGEEIARYLAKVTMGVIIITGYTKKMGIMKGVHEKAKTALKDLVTIGMEFHGQMDENIESMTDTIILFDKLLAGLEGAEEGYKRTIPVTKAFGKEVKGTAEILIDTAIPAYRKFPGLVYNTMSEVKDHVFNANKKIKESFETITIEFRSMTERFIGLAMDMGDAFGSLAYGIMDKGSTLGDNLKGIWTDIKNSFKTLVADYIGDEMKKLFLGIVSKTKDMATNITTGLSGVGKAVGAIGKGLASLITTLASAIAKAATTLAAAAPALLIVLGIALAAYAGFKLIGALFKKKPKTGTMEAILRDISHIQLAAMLDKMDASNFFASEMFPKIDYTNSILAKIENISKGIRAYTKQVAKKLGEITGFQTGGYVPRTQLAVVHAGEMITPPAGRAGGGVSEGQRAQNVYVNLNITAMDSMGVDEFMRNRGIPAIVNAVKINYKGSKTNINKALRK